MIHGEILKAAEVTPVLIRASAAIGRWSIDRLRVGDSALNDYANNTNSMGAAGHGANPGKSDT